jgi:uncharacterized membrane protein YfcA
MTLLSAIVLFAAGLAAGVINSIAGGGTFLTFPALMLTGLDARAANITSTIALFPMQIGTGYAGRTMAGDAPQISFKALLVTSLMGGIVGAILLVLTPSGFFAHLAPWLMMFATVVFAYGSFLKKPGDLSHAHRLSRNGAIFCQFWISVYGGYFGGGIGFLMLAALTLAGMAIRKAGATKNILAAAMNAASVLIFVFSHDVGWAQVGIAGAASFLGGMAGVRMLHHVNERLLRLIVVLIGLALTAAMFIY